MASLVSACPYSLPARVVRKGGGEGLGSGGDGLERGRGGRGRILGAHASALFRRTVFSAEKKIETPPAVVESWGGPGGSSPPANITPPPRIGEVLL